MQPRPSFRTSGIVAVALWLLAGAMSAQAAIIPPSSTDAGRIVPPVATPRPAAAKPSVLIKSEDTLSVPAPADSKKVYLMLYGVNITGMTAFSDEEVADIYHPYLNKRITLDVAWKIAADLTERYRRAGYFLSRAFVPAQDVTKGFIKIGVVEGFIGHVRIEGPGADSSVAQQWVEKLKSYQPLSSDELENVLLQINSLPGYEFHAVMDPKAAKGTSDGVASMVFTSQVSSRASGSLTVDNGQSKFLGPYEASLSYQRSIIAGQNTKISLLTTRHPDHLGYGNVVQEIPVAAGFTADLSATYTHAQPGFTLEPEEIKSTSTGFAIGMNYDWFKQRQDSLSMRAGIDLRDTNTDILGTPLTRDAVRAMRINGSYQRLGDHGSVDNANVTLSHGLDILGSSKAGDSFLSHPEAKPNFNKIELSLSHLQPLPKDWSMLTTVNGQVASGPLYSSEQFGYGGQSFGRAYDSSEITGDHGLIASVELSYNGFPGAEGFRTAPYLFYDRGYTWNESAGLDKMQFGSSLGGGLRLLTDYNITGNFAVAFPIERRVNTPIYGNNSFNPRALMSLSYGF